MFVRFARERLNTESLTLKEKVACRLKFVGFARETLNIENFSLRERKRHLSDDSCSLSNEKFKRERHLSAVSYTRLGARNGPRLVMIVIEGKLKIIFIELGNLLKETKLKKFTR